MQGLHDFLGKSWTIESAKNPLQDFKGNCEAEKKTYHNLQDNNNCAIPFQDISRIQGSWNLNASRIYI